VIASALARCRNAICAIVAPSKRTGSEHSALMRTRGRYGCGRRSAVVWAAVAPRASVGGDSGLRRCRSRHSAALRWRAEGKVSDSVRVLVYQNRNH
jgi:hypothetical protein